MRGSSDICDSGHRGQSMKFGDLQQRGLWEPIRNCPGRYALHDVSPTLSIVDLLGADESIQQTPTPKARDSVWIARLEDGGLISYARSDGSWLHTLNSEEGFERKLKQLEIDVDEHTTRPASPLFK